MRVKVLTLRFSSTLGAIDDTALVEFTRDKSVLSVRDHFFRESGVAYLTCVISYEEQPLTPEIIEQARQIKAGATSGQGRRFEKPDPAAGLDEHDRLLFNTLRSWRSKKARHEGVPPYIIMSNKEFLAIVARKPESLTALGQINGIGKAKVERYGQQILALLHGQRPATSPEAVSPAPSSPETPTPAPAPVTEAVPSAEAAP
jgi:ATP-dependent DNA helicase RecQ